MTRHAGTGPGAKCVNCWNAVVEIRKAIQKQNRLMSRGLPTDLTQVERWKRVLADCPCGEAA